MTQNIKNMKDQLAQPVALVGMMGAGKTTIGRKLAQYLGVPFADSDDAIEAQTGQSVAQIFSEAGEAQFRILEADIIANLLMMTKTGIIALGGGALGSASTRALIRQKAAIIWLKAPPEVLRARVDADHSKRPLLADSNKYATIDRLLAEREPNYQNADIIIDAAASSELIMENIIHALQIKKILRPSTAK